MSSKLVFVFSFSPAPAIDHDRFVVVAYDGVGHDNTCAYKIMLVLKRAALVLLKSAVAIKEWLGAIIHDSIRFLEVLPNIVESGIAHEVVVDALGIVRIQKRERRLSSHLD
jgi:hypothetical protein